MPAVHSILFPTQVYLFCRRVYYIERWQAVGKREFDPAPHLRRTVMFLERWPLQSKHKRIIRLEEYIRIEWSEKVTKYVRKVALLGVGKQHFKWRNTRGKKREQEADANQLTLLVDELPCLLSSSFLLLILLLVVCSF